MRIIPSTSDLTNAIRRQVKQALAEDLSDSGTDSNPDNDLTAQLIPASTQARASLLCRQAAIFCGSAWLNEVFRQVDPNIVIDWRVADGDHVDADTVLCELEGSARCLLTGERAALNFIQTLSATASHTHRYVQAIRHTKARILDTRKTLPGLRRAQKYAVRCGGGHNHRFGLWDAVLIKENHIAACGTIAAAIHASKALSNAKWVEIEVENIHELTQALNAGADRIMLDNFSLPALREAVAFNQQHPNTARLEASGGVNLQTLVAIAETGINDISVGALSKDISAIDLSFRLLP